MARSESETKIKTDEKVVKIKELMKCVFFSLRTINESRILSINYVSLLFRGFLQTESQLFLINNKHTACFYTVMVLCS